MPIYNLEARYLLRKDLEELDGNLVDALWRIFSEIGAYWSYRDETQKMRFEFLTFISNRIEVDYRYLSEYVNAQEVLDELAKDHGGRTKAVEFMLKDVSSEIYPPATKLARARQMVVNEFLTLWLSLGGFTVFAKAGANYQGFIFGANFDKRTPYLKA